MIVIARDEDEPYVAGDEGIGKFGLRSMFVAFIGACVLLLVVGLFTRGRYGDRSP